jgi:Na+/H+ antiporter NhaC
MALSLVSFATLGYGNRFPASKLGEMLGGLEAMLSMILVAMFVVSLTRKYVRG